IDPIDGTVNFLYDLPVVAVSIAARVNDVLVAGAVSDVLRAETFSASTGNGARCDGRTIVTNSVDDLSQALVATGYSYDAATRAAQAAVVSRVLPAARDIRSMGSAALQLCWVACGRVDAYYERDLKPWDIAAGTVIAREAGATVEQPCAGNADLTAAGAPAIFHALRSLL
uniref:inositol monophosphatase family protein n=1 Tax=Ilumatobacter nonamiensis TaxID=467093 RepID=UPI00058B4CFF